MHVDAAFGEAARCPREALAAARALRRRASAVLARCVRGARALLGGALLACLGLAHTASGTDLAPRAAPRIAPTVPAGTLFRLEHPGRPASYLLGTVHSADARVLATLPALDGVLRRVRTLAVEAELGPGDVAAFLEAAQLEGGRHLADEVDAETLRSAHAALDSVLRPELVDRLKPWALFLKVAEDRADTAPTFDVRLRMRARELGLSVVGLELAEEQAAAFDSVPWPSQLALLRYVLADRERLRREHEGTVRAWLAGDIEALATGRDLGHPPELAVHFAALRAAIVEGRSALLAHRLFGPLRSGRVLIAVGAAHLAGERGLIALLTEQGYRVRAVR